MNYLNELFRISKEFKTDCLLNEPMDKHTSFKIGGPADVFINIKKQEQLSEILKVLGESGATYHIIGNGSNLLVDDNGIRGVVLKISDGLSKVSVLENNILKAKAGTRLSKVCMAAFESGLSGLEFAYGIPGNIGGAVFMNAGAYGGEMKDVVISSKHLTLQGEENEFNNKELDFSYRHSIYTNNNFCITSVCFKLVPKDKSVIKEKMDELSKKRKDKQPLNFPSAGSVFKRPQGAFSGALIEECGLKGFSVGGAQISEKHSGFIINTGNATCSDVLGLIKIVRNTVFEKTGFLLESEIKYIK